MTAKGRRSSTTGGWAFPLAQRVGLGIGGAVAGTMAAIYAIDAGLTFLRPPELAAVFTLVGAMAAFFGAAIAPRPAALALAQSTAVASTAGTADSAAVLSAAGTLLADSSAFAAAWLFILQVPPKGIWAVMIGFWWLFGVTAQTSAGILARLRAVDPDIVPERGPP